jgi:ABC-2 type transport system permease protein
MTYRIELLMAVVGMAVMLTATFFFTGALQGTMAKPIRQEAGDYFSFVLIGMIAVTMMQTAVSTLPGAIAGGIRSGTLEAMLATPTRLPWLLAGMSSYAFGWSMLRCVLLLAGGLLVGAHVAWGAVPMAIVVFALLLVPYIAIGVVTSAAVLAFRTAGPIPQAVIVGSTLLGGVYYPTRIIPGGLQRISDMLPLSYGLRALRQVLLAGGGLGDIWPDVRMLLLMAATGSALAVAAFGLALQHARRTGTLAQY